MKYTFLVLRIDLIFEIRYPKQIENNITFPYKSFIILYSTFYNTLRNYIYSVDYSTMFVYLQNE